MTGQNGYGGRIVYQDLFVLCDRIQTTGGDLPCKHMHTSAIQDYFVILPRNDSEKVQVHRTKIAQSHLQQNTQSLLFYLMYVLY